MIGCAETSLGGARLADRLGIYFGHTAIVKEKDDAAYRRLAAERRMERT